MNLIVLQLSQSQCSESVWISTQELKDRNEGSCGRQVTQTDIFCGIVSMTFLFLQSLIIFNKVYAWVQICLMKHIFWILNLFFSQKIFSNKIVSYLKFHIQDYKKLLCYLQIFSYLIFNRHNYNLHICNWTPIKLNNKMIA